MKLWDNSYYLVALLSSTHVWGCFGRLRRWREKRSFLNTTCVGIPMPLLTKVFGGGEFWGNSVFFFVFFLLYYDVDMQFRNWRRHSVKKYLWKEMYVYSTMILPYIYIYIYNMKNTAPRGHSTATYSPIYKGLTINRLCS